MHGTEQPLVIDRAQSRVEADVKATMDSFTGHLQAYTATITVDPAVQRVDAAVFSFRFADFKTGKAKRDAKMLEWEDTTRHPEVTFRLDRLQAGARGRIEAHGEFTFHGVTRPLVFPVEVNTDGQLYAIDGQVAIDTRDYGLPIIRVMAFLKVDPVVTVHFHLQGHVAKAGAVQS